MLPLRLPELILGTFLVSCQPTPETRGHGTRRRPGSRLRPSIEGWVHPTVAHSVAQSAETVYPSRSGSVSKTVSGFWVRRGFKSLPLRSTRPETASLRGFRPGCAARARDAHRRCRPPSSLGAGGKRKGHPDWRAGRPFERSCRCGLGERLSRSRLQLVRCDNRCRQRIARSPPINAGRTARNLRTTTVVRMPIPGTPTPKATGDPAP